jgi:signal transduction histidine kinase/DNA-binding NarL/FixJ family response regulator
MTNPFHEAETTRLHDVETTPRREADATRRQEADDTLHVLASGPIEGIDSCCAREPLSPIAWCVLVSISDRLFELNERGAPDPNLISSYAVSGNGTIYRFQIQSERRFHNGDEVTSDDVMESLATAAATHPEGSRLLDLLEHPAARGAAVGSGLRRISRYRFEVQLKDRCDDLLHYLALPCNSIRSRRATEGSVDGFSGPYRVERSDPTEWELSIEKDHPAARPRSFARILVHGPTPDGAPLDVAGHAQGGPVPRSTGSLSPHDPTVVVFGEPFPAPQKSPGGFTERLARLPGERLFYLRLRPDISPTDNSVRILKQACDAAGLKKAFFGLRPPTFIPAIPACPAGPADRASAAPRSRGIPTFSVAFDEGSLRADFLDAVASECRARGATVRFVSGASVPLGAETPECHAHLRAIFVGHSVDELGFFQHLAVESESAGRAGGRSYSAALLAARRASSRIARTDAIRRLAGEIGPELGIVPLFQATVGLLVDRRIDRESLTSAAGFTSFASLHRRSARFDQAELNQAMLTALGAATQMFAHDVRRPFSMVRILLDMIRNAGSLAEVREMAVRMLPEVERALGAVDGMIQDILEIGTAREPVREVVTPDGALDAGLREVFETRAHAAVRFAYHLSHTRPFHACPHQVHRVFANILSNAADAMQNRGEIRCETEDVIAGGQPFVRVCIGNTGSYIEPADLPRIFDAFFSKGKRGGTGLGLAITKKVIEAHEGRIWCVSDRTRGVRFCFTLPAHETESRSSLVLPPSSREIVEDYQQRTALSLSEDERRALEREKLLAGNLVAFRQTHRRRLRIWVIDDEAIYAEGIRNLIKDAPWFEDNVEIVSLRDEAMVYEALAHGRPDACICDIDLGAESPDGFAVTLELRRRGIRAVIYIHSNRSVSQDYRHAIEVGADAFLPKPMSRPHLVRLLDETTRECATAPREAEPEPPDEAPVAEHRPPREIDPESPIEAPDEAPVEPPVDTSVAEQRPLIVVVDDDIFMRRAWVRRVPDARVLAYRGPLEFWSNHPADDTDMANIDCLVTDYHFGAGETEPVEEFLRKLKATAYEGPVILCSDNCDSTVLAGLIDARMEKRPIPWREIRDMLERLRA